MSLFPDIDREEELEDALQFAAAGYLLRLERRGLLTSNHSPQEGARTDAEREKLAAKGTRSGHPDLDVFMAGGRTTFFELKTRSGWVNPKQKDRHEALRQLGFDVHVIKSPTTEDCERQISAILRDQYEVRL